MWIKIIFVLFTTAYVLLILTGTISSDRKLGPSEYALIVFTILFVADFFEKLAEISFGKEGFRFQLNQVQGRQKDIEAILSAIQVVLKGIITKYEYKHLVDLNTSSPCWRKFGYIFFEEIKRLDAIGFIRPTPTFKSFNIIKDKHEHDESEFNLKDYMEITEEGKTYLTIRKAIEAKER